MLPMDFIHLCIKFKWNANPFIASFRNNDNWKNTVNGYLFYFQGVNHPRGKKKQKERTVNSIHSAININRSGRITNEYTQTKMIYVDPFFYTKQPGLNKQANLKGCTSISQRPYI